MQDDESRSSTGRDKYRDEQRHRSRERDRDRDRDRDRGDRRDHRHRDRSRERRRDDGHRTADRYRSDRNRDDRNRDDRNRDRSHRGDRHDRDRDGRGSSKRDRSGSRNRDRRRSRDRQQREGSRSREGSTYSKDRERGRRDLSVEIEQELQNLRKLSDMKAAASAKAQEAAAVSGETGSELKSIDADSSNSNGLSTLDAEEPKSSISKYFSSNGSSSKTEYVPEIQTEEERIEFQKKMQEKLQAHLAAEGKLYPKPKPTPAINTATGFANDGSFLEMFKKMQEQACGISAAGEESYPSASAAVSAPPATAATTIPPTTSAASSSHVVASVQPVKPHPVPISIVGRRRGGKILKTGVVKKQKPIEESFTETPNDAWNLYLQEVKKYKNASCDADSKTRPLVK